MKALYYISSKIKGDDILYGLLQLNIEAERSELIVELDELSDDQIDQIAKESKDFDFVISRNFSVNIAEGCHISGVPYLAWCYDSPVMTLYRKEALYDTNRIFAFDKKHIERLKKIGLTEVYYQPLAANMVKANRVIISDSDLRKYRRDISFIGSIYYKGYYSTIAADSPSEYRKECDELFERHLCRWDKGNTIFDELSEPAAEYFYDKLSKTGRDEHNITDRFLTELLLLVYELTSRERIYLLNECAKKYNVIIHTHEPENYGEIIKAKINGPLKELSDELFRIYAASKININLTMRSIETGVPQRVYDILSVGGCVFSNYQEEAEELFAPDKEIVLFKSLDEFMDKADYYIRHEKERLEIGARGYLRVRDEYNYPNAIRNMINHI